MPLFDKSSPEYEQLVSLKIVEATVLDQALQFDPAINLATILSICKKVNVKSEPEINLVTLLSPRQKVEVDVVADPADPRSPTMTVATLLALSGAQDSLNSFLETDEAFWEQYNGRVSLTPTQYFALTGQNAFLFMLLENNASFSDEKDNVDSTVANYLALNGNVDGLITLLKKYPALRAHSTLLAATLAKHGNIQAAAIFIQATPSINLNSAETSALLKGSLPRATVQELNNALNSLEIPKLKAQILTNAPDWKKCLTTLQSYKQTNVPDAAEAYEICHQFHVDRCTEALLKLAKQKNNSSNHDTSALDHYRQEILSFSDNATTVITAGMHQYYENKANDLRKQALEKFPGALQELQKLASQHPVAQVALGRYYKKLAQLAATNKRSSVTIILSKLQTKPSITTEPSALSFKNFEAAAQQGDDTAFYAMGKCCEAGLGTDLSIEQALWNYFLAANLGNQRALKKLQREWSTEQVTQCCLANVYSGLLEQTIDITVNYFRLAAAADRDLFLTTVYNLCVKHTLSFDQKKHAKECLKIVIPQTNATHETTSNVSTTNDDDDDDDEDYSWMKKIIPPKTITSTAGIDTPVANTQTTVDVDTPQTTTPTTENIDSTRETTPTSDTVDSPQAAMPASDNADSLRAKVPTSDNVDYTLMTKLNFVFL